MKTLAEIQSYARAIAQSHYYADFDDLSLWEPFEGYSHEWVQEEITSMADMITRAMVWAQT